MNMPKFVWISIFFVINIVSALAIIRIISIQQTYKATNEQPVSNAYTERGPIFDRNGNILAMQVDSWHVGLRLIDISSPQETIELLSQILNIEKQTIQDKLEDTNKYVRIKKFIQKTEYKKILEYQEKGKLSGVQLQPISWRRYPGKDSLSHVIGYFGENGKGLDGIEASFEEYLSPQISGIGNSIYLTIDSVLQKNIEEIVSEILASSEAEYITTILMHAKSGEILAYVSKPGFDLNYYYTVSQDLLQNKIISHSYEPGSVFKVFSIASVLDAGIISAHTLYDARSPYVDPKYSFVIKDVQYPGIINTSEIIKYSSNVGVSLATYNMDDTLLYHYLTKFGFGNKTNIPLLGESRGIFYPVSNWSARSKQTIALGQEIAVTAMQIVKAATVLANNGMLLQPSIVKRITSPTGKTIYEHNAEQLEQVIKPEIAQQILAMMQSATIGGTARRLKMDGINISAKTGTAQIFDLEKKIYSDTDFIASTLSIVPTENPELIIYSAIHKPQSGEVYGGRTTAPMIKKMFEFILPYQGLVGTSVASNTQLDNDSVSNQKPHTHIITEKFGNYKGLTKREIWSIFTNSNIDIYIEGNGRVVSQDPAPNTPTASYLKLYFE